MTLLEICLFVSTIDITPLSRIIVCDLKFSHVYLSTYFTSNVFPTLQGIHESIVPPYLTKLSYIKRATERILMYKSCRMASLQSH